MRCIFLTLLASLLAISCGGTKQDSLTEEQALQEIMQLQRKLVVAEKRKDKKVFERVLLENYSIILPNGEQFAKNQLLMLVENGEILFGNVEFKDLDIKLLGNTAVVTGHFTIDGKFQGRPIRGEYRGGAVFEKRGDEWFVAYEHLGPKIEDSKNEESE